MASADVEHVLSDAEVPKTRPVKYNPTTPLPRAHNPTTSALHFLTFKDKSDQYALVVQEIEKSPQLEDDDW